MAGRDGIGVGSLPAEVGMRVSGGVIVEILPRSLRIRFDSGRERVTRYPQSITATEARKWTKNR
jgi:hypothetical protein